MQRERLPNDRKGLTHRFVIHATEEGEPRDFKGYVTANCYEDGRVGEIFLRMDRAGSALRGLIDSWAIGVSMLLQQGTPLETIVEKYKGTRFEPSGRTETPGLRLATSPVDYVVRYLERRFIHKKPLVDDAASDVG